MMKGLGVKGRVSGLALLAACTATTSGGSGTRSMHAIQRDAHRGGSAATRAPASIWELTQMIGTGQSLSVGMFSAYPRNIYGETPHGAMASQITSLFRQAGGSDLVTVHSVVGENGQGIAMLGHHRTGAPDRDVRLTTSRLRLDAGKRSGIARATLVPWQIGVDQPDEIVCSGPKYQSPYPSDNLHSINRDTSCSVRSMARSITSASCSGMLGNRSNRSTRNGQATWCAWKTA